MKLEIRNNKDFWAGMMFFVIGAGAIFVARNYPFGTTMQMGPGYFPLAISGILIAISLFIMVRGLLRNEKIQGTWSIRPITMLPLSMIIFGVMMELMGFVFALIVLVFMSALSGSDFRFKEILFLAIGLTVLSVAMFVWGLGLPYPLVRQF